MDKNYPIRITVSSKEKRYVPVKHYVFVVSVKWSDTSTIPIYRQYSDFAQLHSQLKEIADKSNPPIQMPEFPVKKLFQRQEIQREATKKRNALDDYCHALLKLPSIVSRHPALIEFFKTRHDDVNPPEQSTLKPEKVKSNLLNALTVLRPKNDGKEKKALKLSKSAGKLEGIDEDDPIYVSSPIICETYLVLADYTPVEKSELKLKEGSTVEVVEKYDNGWWFVQTEYGYGWAPSTYLSPLDQTEDEQEPIYSGQKYLTNTNYQSEQPDEISFTSGALVKVLHKLLDGWWIIRYQGQVGYAPATYMVPFNNPHCRDSKYGIAPGGRPTKRRSTIKNSKGKPLRAPHQLDLTIYKKLSDRMSLAEVSANLPEADGNSDCVADNDVSDKNGETPEVTKHDYEEIDEDDMDKEDISSWLGAGCGIPKRSSMPCKLPSNMMQVFKPLNAAPIAFKKSAANESQNPDTSNEAAAMYTQVNKSANVHMKSQVNSNKDETDTDFNCNQTQTVISKEIKATSSLFDPVEIRVEPQVTTKENMAQQRDDLAAVDKDPAGVAECHSKEVKGHLAMDMLINTLRSKEIDSVRFTNDGELVIKFINKKSD